MTGGTAIRNGLLGLLLLAVAAGIYLYVNFEAILAAQTGKMLSAYGVSSYELQGSKLGLQGFSAQGIQVSGDHLGYTYNVSLQQLDIAVTWASLLAGQAERIALSSLVVKAEHTPLTSLDDTTTVIDSRDLLPGELLDALPARHIDIENLRLVYSAPDLPPLDVNGSISYDKALTARLETDIAGALLSGAVEGSRDGLSIDLRAGQDQDKLELARVTVALRDPGDDSLAWSLQGTWHYEALLNWLRQAGLIDPAERYLPPGMVLRGSGKVSAEAQQPADLLFSVPPDWHAIESIAGTATVSTALEQLDYPDSVQKIATDLEATVALDEGELSATLSPLAISGSINPVLLGLSPDVITSLDWTDYVRLQAGTASSPAFVVTGERREAYIESAALVIGDRRNAFTLTGLDLDARILEDTHTTYDIKASTRLLARIDRQPLPVLLSTFTLEGGPGDSVIALSLQDDTAALSAAARGNIDPQTGEGYVDIETRSDDLAGLGSVFLPPLTELDILPPGIVITSGTFALNTRLDTAGFEPASWSQRSSIQLAGISGFYGEYAFDRLGLQGDLTGIDTLKTTRPLELSLDLLNVGFEIANIRASASLPRPTPIASPVIRLDTLTADLFGGRAFLTGPTEWDTGAVSNTATFEAENWQLQQVVALQQSEDISAQGVLEGKLPVTLAGSRVIIDSGYLKALPPGGLIRYVANDASAALGQSSGELALALGLLSDFRYEVLSSDVNLDPQGNLLLGLSLYGHNPEQYEGRAVEFNINLEQNLDPLLQSLRLSGKLTEELENRLQ